MPFIKTKKLFVVSKNRIPLHFLKRWKKEKWKKRCMEEEVHGRRGAPGKEQDTWCKSMRGLAQGGALYK